MGKMKVHELAKELNMQSKELMDKLIKLKYDVKSHLSTLEDADVEKIRKQLKKEGSSVAPNDKKKEEEKSGAVSGRNTAEKEKTATKKEKKPIAPVIIRREVTRVVDTTENTNRPSVASGRDDLGVVQRRTDTSMNIKYRTPPRKIGTITQINGDPNGENQEKKIDTPIKDGNTSTGNTKSTLNAGAGAEKVQEENTISSGATTGSVKTESAGTANVAANVSAEKTSGASGNTATSANVNTSVNSNVNTGANTGASANANSVSNGEQLGAKEKSNTTNSVVSEKSGTNGNNANLKNNNQGAGVQRANYDNRTQNSDYRGNGQRQQFNRNLDFKRPNFNRDSGWQKQGQSRENDTQRANYDKGNNGSNQRFDRNQNGGQRFDKFDRNNRNENRDGRDGRFQNKDQRGKGGFNRPGDRQNVSRESKVEKELKGIVANSEVSQKEAARETFRTGYKDKEKDNRKFEESSNTKKNKGRNSRGEENDINYGKLRDLQSESNFSNMFDDTESKIFDYYDVSKRKGGKKNKKKPTESKEHIDQKIFELTDIDIPETITVKDLAEKLKKQATEVIKKLMMLGIMATLNNELDFDTAFLISSEFGVTAHKKEVVSDEDILFDDTDDNEEDLEPRPPIVVVMGHVDHGKTSLLDAIRSTNVTTNEAGGITQHIGAYKVEINGREITFIDTPGHEAFTAMRARGAQVTDVAIIVVAADDGVMPQTIEAINHAKAAGVSIIVAINKIDKEGADIDRIKREIMEYGLVPEEWGGDVICVPISAKQNKNIDSLLEMILLVADMKELKSNPNKQSKGTVIEARLDKNTGITASLLVQRGTLNIGDTIVVGSVIGKIRGMTDDKGQKVKAAGPSTPVEVIGLPEVPEAGETFYEVENEKVAKHLIEKRKRKQREEMLRKSSPVTLDNLFNQIEEGKLKDLNIIIKADLQGSVQALKASLEKIRNEEARVRIVHSNVGGITESDVTLAKVTNSIIIGFNVRADATAKSIADKDGVEIKLYSVIYNAIDDVEAALKGMLQPKYKEVIQGTAEIRQTFKITGAGMIAGCYVLDGKIVRNSGLRVIRENVVVHTGKLASLKRMKDDAKEVAAGYECGVQIENYEDIKVGDKLESFILEEIKD